MLDMIVPPMRVQDRSPRAMSSPPKRKRRRMAVTEREEHRTKVGEEHRANVGEEHRAKVDVGVLEETNRSCADMDMESSRSCGANVIGEDLLAEVFSRLPFEERMRTVPLVCKAWRNAACDPTCWRIVDMEGWLERRIQEDMWWEFECELRVEFLIKKIVDRSCGQLRELRTMHCSDGAIEYIADRCPLLTVLSIRNSPLVTDKSTSKLAASCPELQELDVSDCYNISNQALEALRRWKPRKLQIRPLVLYFFWQHMLRIYMSSCKLES
ncbi:unnamed protein product [Calypogeia fissa]